MGDVFIWRRSIQKKKGHCPKCGALLVGDNNYPTDNVGIDEKTLNGMEHGLWCMGCYKKGKPYFVGVHKEVNDKAFTDIQKAHEMFGEMNWSDLSKAVSSKAASDKKSRQEVETLERTIKQQEFTIGMLKGSMEQIKTMHEKELAEKDRRIQELTKELNGLEAEMRRMEQQMVGGE